MGKREDAPFYENETSFDADAVDYTSIFLEQEKSFLEMSEESIFNILIFSKNYQEEEGTQTQVKISFRTGKMPKKVKMIGRNVVGESR